MALERLKSPISKGITDLGGGKSAVRQFHRNPIVQVAMRQDDAPTDREYAVLYLNAVNDEGLLFTDYVRILSSVKLEFEGVVDSAFLPLEMPEVFAFHRKALHDLLAERPGIHLQFQTIADSISSKLVCLPIVILSRKKLSMRYRVLAEDMETSLNYAATILVSEFRDDLRHCKRPDCRNFFLVDAKKKKYCGEHCRKLALDADKGLRTAAGRAGLTAKEWRLMLEADPNLTLQAWQEAKEKRPSLDPQKWLKEKAKQA